MEKLSLGEMIFQIFSFAFYEHKITTVLKFYIHDLRWNFCPNLSPAASLIVSVWGHPSFRRYETKFRFAFRSKKKKQKETARTSKVLKSFRKFCFFLLLLLFFLFFFFLRYDGGWHIAVGFRGTISPVPSGFSPAVITAGTKEQPGRTHKRIKQYASER